MKRLLLAIIALASVGTLMAQPKVAVLDTIIGDKVDTSVIVPVTEKVIEQLVQSGKYTVLDRANTTQVLGEREFQLSGMVSDQEITEAGKYLGADYVVVIRVLLMADTYVLTSKMIDVKTGVIASQTSAEGEGKISILLRMAGTVGQTLAGGSVAEAPAVAAAPAQAPAPAVSKPAKPAPVPASLPSSSEYADFNFIQRLLASATNPVLGLGSFVMGDWITGSIVAGGEALGVLIGNAWAEPGLIVFSASVIYGVIMPWLYHKPMPKAAMLDGFNLALLPDGAGGSSVFASYVLNF